MFILSHRWYYNGKSWTSLECKKNTQFSNLCWRNWHFLPPTMWQCRQSMWSDFGHNMTYTYAHMHLLINEMICTISYVPIDTLSEKLVCSSHSSLLPSFRSKNNWLEVERTVKMGNRKEFSRSWIWLTTNMSLLFIFLWHRTCCDRHVGLWTHIK